MVSFKIGIKRARKNAHLTQEKLVEEYNNLFATDDCSSKETITIDSVKKWESGQTVPRSKELIRLCELFGCDMSYLFNQSGYSTHDLSFICSQTGLTEEAVKVLKRIASSNRRTGYSDIISVILEEDFNLEYLLSLLSRRLSYSKGKEIHPEIIEIDGEHYFSNFHEYDQFLRDNTLPIEIDGGNFQARKDNLLSSLIQNAIAERLNHLSAEYLKRQKPSSELEKEYKDFIHTLSTKQFHGELTEEEARRICDLWFSGQEIEWSDCNGINSATRKQL